MSPKQILHSVLDERFRTEDGEEFSIKLHSGLSEPEYRDFAARFPVPPPDEIRELLLFARGFDFDPVEEVDFQGGPDFGFEQAFPLGLPICGDGFGNFWVVDVNPESGAWAPIFYACHDPPVIAYQAPTLAVFLEELFKLGRLDATNTVDHVHEKEVMEIWRQNAGLLPAPEARQSSDPVLRSFAERLEERALIADLRNAEVGAGFSWGRYDPGTVRRDGARLLFAMTPSEKKGLFRWLFGRQ